MAMANSLYFMRDVEHPLQASYIPLDHFTTQSRELSTHFNDVRIFVPILDGDQVMPSYSNPTFGLETISFPPKALRFEKPAPCALAAQLIKLCLTKDSPFPLWNETHPARLPLESCKPPSSYSLLAKSGAAPTARTMCRKLFLEEPFFKAHEKVVRPTLPASLIAWRRELDLIPSAELDNLYKQCSVIVKQHLKG